jgi:hypothetical protein
LKSSNNLLRRNPRGGSGSRDRVCHPNLWILSFLAESRGFLVAAACALGYTRRVPHGRIPAANHTLTYGTGDT